MKKILYGIGCIILFILVVYLLVFLFWLVVTFFKSFTENWLTLKGWVYLLALIVGALILVLLRVLMEDIVTKKYKCFTPYQLQQLEIAKGKIEKEKAAHEKKVQEFLEKERKELEKPYASVFKKIEELEKQKELYQAEIDKTTVLHPYDMKFEKSVFSDPDSKLAEKAFSLKYTMETNRADNIREALILYDREQAEIKTQALIRHYEENKKRSEDNFKEEQLRLLKEQNRQIEKARIEQEESNKKIIRQNEELLNRTKDY